MFIFAETEKGWLQAKNYLGLPDLSYVKTSQSYGFQCEQVMNNKTSVILAGVFRYPNNIKY